MITMAEPRRQHVACVTDAYSVIFNIDTSGMIRAYQGMPRDASR